MSDDVVVFGAELERRDRTLKSGAVKSRYVINVKSDRLVFNLSPKALGKKPAEAIIKLLRERIEDISRAAAPRTVKAREVAARALERGAAWAERRYAGGRIGAMAPDRSDRLYNDSGRFAKSITGSGNEEGWKINVAANRLSLADLGSEERVMKMWELLKSLVPELEDPGLLADSIPVRNAINESIEESTKVAKGESLDLVLEILNEAVEAIAAIDEIVG